MVEEVLDDGRCSLGDWGTVVLYDTKERRHGVQIVVGRATFKQLDDDTAYAPEFARQIGRRGGDEGINLTRCLTPSLLQIAR